MGYISEVNLDGQTHKLSSSLLGTCGTTASTVEKVVALPDYTEYATGSTIRVKFTYSNSAASPTLNVNSLGALPIYRYGSTAPGESAETSWNAGAIIAFTYDGTSWVMNDWNNKSLVMTGATSEADGTSGAVPAPAAGDANRYLRSDGTWAVPPVDSTLSSTSTNPVQNKVINTALGTKIDTAGAGLSKSGTTLALGGSGATAGSYGPSEDVTGTNNTTLSVPYITVDRYGRVTSIANKTYTSKDSNTTYSAGTGLSLSSNKFSLATSGATAGNYGPSSNVSGTNGTTMSVPYITIDNYGRVTAIANKTYTSKDTVYSLPLAANGTRGGVQIGYSTSGKNYAVALSGEKMYVNVPWTDNNTTYSAGTGLNLSSNTFSAKLSNSLTTTDATTALNLTGAKSLNDNKGIKGRLLWQGSVKSATTTNLATQNAGFSLYLVLYNSGGDIQGAICVSGSSIALTSVDLSSQYKFTVYRRTIKISATNFVTGACTYARPTEYGSFEGITVTHIYGITNT